MSSTEKSTTILGKIDEMRDFLRIGDEVIPFLGELFQFIQDIMPLMSDVNASFRDSTSKLPDAKDRIHDVTQATEMATNEILDKLDSISTKVDSITKGLDDEKKQMGDTIFNEVQDITMALQFQDITSQKLEHANKILNAISDKFTELQKATDSIKVSTKIGEKMMQELTSGIDPEKRRKEKEEFEKKTEDIVRHEEISQDDIDALFA